MKRTKSLVARSAQGRKCSVGCVRSFPVLLLHEVVELDEVHVVHAETRERGLELAPGCFTVALARLGREEVVIAVADQPGCDAQLGVAVAGGGVEVVDAMLTKHFENAVSRLLASRAERGTAEYHSSTGVAGSSESRLLDHERQS